MLKIRLWRFSNWLSVIVSKPVVLSITPPVARWYAWNASVASRRSVVPVSTMPAEPERRVVSEEPYVTSWSMPQYAEAGEVEVMGTNVTSPVVLLVSTLPKVSSPLVISRD